MKNKFKGISALLLATAIWGSSFVAQSVGMDHIGPFTFQAIRCFFAVVGLLPVILISDGIKRKKAVPVHRWNDRTLWKAGFLCGVPLFLASNLQQLGLCDTDAGKSAFLTAMYIVFVPILGLLLKKKLPVIIPFSALLAVCGLYFLCCVEVTSIRPGDLMLLGCALMFAVQILFVDRFAESLDPLKLNLLLGLVCSALSGILVLFVEAPTWQGIFQCILPLSYAGFLSMGLAFSLQIIGQKHLEPAGASLLMSLESVFAVLAAWLLLGDLMTLWESIGCVLVFLAVILSQIPDKAFKKCLES